VSIMRRKMIPVEAPDDAIDIVGTGGDGAGTLNISTGASIVVAAAGVPVAKHGKPALASKPGSAEALHHLGISLERSPERLDGRLRRRGGGGRAGRQARQSGPVVQIGIGRGAQQARDQSGAFA